MPGFVAIIALFGVQADERIVWPTADGFVVAHRQANEQQSIEEQVPKGETVEHWTRMITTLSVSAPIGPADFANRMAGMWRQTCPGAKGSEPVAGLRGVDIRIECPLNRQTGKPETMFQRTVSGSGKLYILQVAFRSLPTSEQAQWATAQLDRAVLCHAGSTEKPCA